MRSRDLIDVGKCVRIPRGNKKRSDGKLYTNGGRVLGVTALGETLLKDALSVSIRKCRAKSRLKDAHYRTDIGKK